MPRVHTHYDNLKVSRDAPAEVIHAAYKALASKYGSGLKAGDPEATRIAMVVSRSYVVLCDPEQRAEHDRWISETETGPMPTPPRTVRTRYNRRSNRSNKLPVWIGVAVFAAVVIAGFVSGNLPAPNAHTSAPVPVTATQEKQLFPSAYVRPERDDNGDPWPAKSAYIGKVGDAGGHSTFTIDNSENDVDMLVKLCTPQPKCPSAFRTLLLKARDRFTMKRVAASEYTIHYKDIDHGAAWKSQPFTLEETEDARHITATDASLTLYEILNGNTHPERIGPDEF